MVKSRKSGFVKRNLIPALGMLAAVCALAMPGQAQVRGVYPVGMSATNSGVTPESGFTYANLFILYARDELKGPNGEVLATGQNSIIMDMNSFVFVSRKKIRKLGGAVFSFSATLPIANYSLTQVFPLQEELRLQLGLVGYGQWQTTDKSGPTITSAQAAAHYKVNALGFSANIILPARKVSLGVKYFREFENRSTFQGYSL